MDDAARRAVAIVGVGAILPDAPDARTFWENVKNGRYSIRDVPPERWDPALYYDPDPAAPDKTYSKLGAWVREWEWEPMRWHLPVPPRVSDAMDEGQKWAVAASRAALLDFGHPERALDLERTAVVIGNAMAGEHHYLTSLRIHFPRVAHLLGESPAFAALSPQQRETIARELGERMAADLPEVTEDTMPGELANVMAGRVANLFDLHGPNYTCDAACAAALAAIDAAVDGLIEEQFDAVLAGGVDRNMGPEPFVKFSKIGALSATGTRPYADGADGFVMGEGAIFFVLKRLVDAERAGDRVYAVLRGIAGSSDGRGKGITAPNPVGQRLSIERAWRRAGVPKASVGLIEGHGTSTRVGDVVEADSLSAVFADCGLAPGSVPLGSVKSNIGHLKGAAGAAGLLKAVFALDEKLLPPSLHFDSPNPNIDFAHSPFFVNTELKPWDKPPQGVRRAGVSAFGFGGTNFHAVLEEHVPGSLTRSRSSVAVPAGAGDGGAQLLATPLRGALVLGAASVGELRGRLERVAAEAAKGTAPPPQAPAESDLRAAERIAIDYGDAAELARRAGRALEALGRDEPAMWRVLRAQGVFRGSGDAPGVAFLYTGQGSQYANMLRGLRESEPVVAEVFADADRVMQPILGRPLTDFLFPDPGDAEAVKAAEESLRRTEITQPAVLSVDVALTRLLARYGVTADFVMGHSLGEYGALVSSGALPFEDALEAVAARGHEMASLEVPDKGRMAAVMAPLETIERVVDGIEGEVVVANVNSTHQAVIGGATAAVEAAMQALSAEGVDVVPLPVSHAFHTSIVAPASEPLRRVLSRLRLAAPEVPLVGNVDGEFYPAGPDAVAKMIELLGAQVASPVQFVKGLETLYAAGARVFVEVGPKKALFGFAEDVLGGRGDAVALFTNHPKQGELVSFNQALCGLYAAGLGVGRAAEARAPVLAAEPAAAPASLSAPAAAAGAAQVVAPAAGDARYEQLGRLFAEFLERGSRIFSGEAGPAAAAEPVVVSGASLGLPGGERVFSADAVRRILDGEQLIDVIPSRHRHAILDKHITRLVKTGGGDPHFESIDRPGDVIKLAGRAAAFDLEEEFGVPGERVAAFDVVTRLAVAAGIEALHDAGIPLVMHYRTTRKGTRIPERWMLPESLRDETGVIFASAFPGADSLVDEVTRYHQDRARAEQIEDLHALRARAEGEGASAVLREEIERRIHELEQAREQTPHRFDRRFLFRVLAMGHSQFAEYVGARGPNTQLNSACASTTQAFSLAEDWIRAGRCRRVVVVAADDVTTDHLLEWIGAGFLSTGAAAIDGVVEDAALPFDRRRHGMILGMGAAGFVIERPEAARERGLRPICEVLSTVTANSAFHGTRLDVVHIAGAMEQLVAQAERRFGLDRRAIAPELLFVSHETYTPARGGSASAEVNALRSVFGDAADSIVVANTKGLTGHAMGVGIEDAVAVKALETGVVPAVPNFAEPDPELGPLNLSKGGVYPIRYALRLGAGFGSQVSFSLLRWVASADGHRPHPDALGYATRVVDPGAWRAWLERVTGDSNPALEVVKRTLRAVDRGRAARPAAGPPAAAEAVARPLAAPAPVAEPALPAPAPVPEPLAAASAPAASDALAERVLAIVSEKTGYPGDMLELDLDLEADLGIDTVKQAETFAAIREAYEIPRDENLKLRDYPTLEHVIAFVRERRPDLVAAAPAAAPAAASQPAAPSAAPESTLLRGDDAAAAAVPRRVPVPVLRPALELCVETGVGLDEGARVAVMPDRGGVAQALVRRLEKRGVEVLDLGEAGEELAERLAQWSQRGPVRGLYWLPALDSEPALGDLDLAQWRAALALRVKGLYAAARALGDALGGAGSFLVVGTRLGGQHGADEAGASAPLGGGVTGFAKAYKREQPECLVKAVDFAESRKTAELADALVEEVLRDPGCVEVGRAEGERWSLALEERALPAEAGAALAPGSVFVVTGAAGGIVSAITADLAAAGGGVFHLLDLVPAPDPADPDVALFRSSREALQRELAERLRGRGERGTPVQVAREMGAVERAHSALAALDAVRAAGGEAVWHGVDLTDGEAVAKVVSEVLARHGKVDVLVHAAGLERSHGLQDKPPEEFDLVFDVKADGWFNLLHALGDAPLGATVCFSSIAGRFGNAGQTDYSAANDLLCKLTSNLRRTRPDTRGVAIDWTAWGGLGMATRGSIPQLMERAGIDMLPASAGIPIVRRELAAGSPDREVVVAGALGVLLQEWEERGGLDPAALAGRASGPMLGGDVAFTQHAGLRVRTRLEPLAQPFLDHHRIDGTPVLPGVMGLEGFAELARLLQPERHVVALEDAAFLAPFKFYRDEPREVELCARFGAHEGGASADCALIGRRALAGRDTPQETVHFRARARLADAAPAEATAGVPAAPGGKVVDAADVYRVYFHGPAYQVLEAAWREDGKAVGRLADPLPANHSPAELPLVAAPRLVELCFQTAGIFEIGATGRLGLPRAIARLELFPAAAAPAGPVHAVVTPAATGFDAVVVDAGGRVCVRLEGYETAALPDPLDAERIAPLRAVFG